MGAATLVAPLRRHRLVASSLTITALTVVARLATAARELLIARQFGVSSDADGYFVAVAVPAVLASAVWIALQVAVVPAQTSVRAEGGTSNDLLVPLIRTVARRLGVVSLAMAVLAWPIVALLGSGFDEHTASLARGLLVIMAPTVMLSGVSGVLSGSLTAGRRFGMSVAGQVINGVVAIVAFLVLRDALGITAAALGVLVGFIAEVIAIGVVVRLPWAEILAPRRDQPRSLAFRAALAMATPLVIATLVTISNGVIDQGMAGTLESGSVAALAYASRLVFFATIPLLAFSTAVFPGLAERIVAREGENVGRMVSTRARQVLLVGVALVPFVVVFGRVVVEQLLTSHSDTSVATVASTLSIYALMLPAFGVSFLLLRVLTALNRSRWVMWTALASAGVNLVGDLVLKGPFGLQGIAACTAIVQTGTCLALAVAVKVALDREPWEVSDGPEDDVEARDEQVVER
jgi:putative peptidoglycan lipid II flippase